MSFLTAGASASEAVEAAIRCLEENEATNAGFGSNLNIDGVVECDATIVDHLGRSGACGAVPGIKHPISLAKVILDASCQPLSLQRTPPNILVGLGAKEFAEEHRVATFPNEYLISRDAKERYLRWSEDLSRAEAKRDACLWKEQRTAILTHHGNATNRTGGIKLPDRVNTTLTNLQDEGQSNSPKPDGAGPGDNGPPSLTVAPAATRSVLYGRSSAIPNASRSTGCSPVRAFQIHDSTLAPARRNKTASPSNPIHDGSAGADGGGKDRTDDFDSFEAYGFDATCGKDSTKVSRTDHGSTKHGASVHDTDVVTDTVGAIAIDVRGYIAAGSSSGGIGMKHRGRIGPAALVGVGTAVVPEDPDDDLATSVAAVISGTGEHMATTFASAKCAERLSQGTRRGPGGQDIREEDEHALLEAFILDDFLGHPGVKNQSSLGAIGVMAVKRDRSGIYFYFAHNTDSFALASMSSTEREPLCVMSRLGNSKEVAQGARKIRLE
ncbi:Threonine aspartase 1 [Madurella mycetomatis]|uniref:Threonine aspartase 1 n=1 Tax=Madurella mycetomatis TaxID=100816 RepID=A0A175WG42_9PEZI|nr:Threonine aspartase 1 [Madurella mycetomatis]